MSVTILRKRINYFLNQIRQGSIPQTANRLTRLNLGRGIPVNVQSRLGNTLKRNLQRSRHIFNARRMSDVMRRADTVSLPFRSHLGNKYEVKYRFTVTDIETGISTVYERQLGYNRLPRKKQILADMLERTQVFLMVNLDKYPGRDVDMESLEFIDMVEYER